MDFGTLPPDAGDGSGNDFGDDLRADGGQIAVEIWFEDLNFRRRRQSAGHESVRHRAEPFLPHGFGRTESIMLDQNFRNGLSVRQDDGFKRWSRLPRQLDRQEELKLATKQPSPQADVYCYLHSKILYRHRNSFQAKYFPYDQVLTDISKVKVVGTQDAAKRLGISPTRIATMIRTGLIKAEKIGRSWVIEESEIERVMHLKRPPGRPRKSK
jgi:excisionase family DNA binding protein